MQIRLISNAAIGDHYLQVHNLYNEPSTQPAPVLTELQMVLREEGRFNNEGPGTSTQHIIVGDFNIHHPIWGGSGARADSRAAELIVLLDEFHLSSNLPTGTPTYFSAQGNETTIDLCLTTEELTEQVMKCRTREDLDHNSDHMPIETILNISIGATPPLEKYSWECLDHIKFEGMLHQKLPNPPSRVATPEAIDFYTEELSKIISAAIAESTPKTVVTTKATPGFDEKCKAARSKANQARRNFQKLVAEESDMTNVAQTEWKIARATKKKLVRQTLRKKHRKAVEEAAGDVSKAWKLANWAKNRQTPFKPTTPFLRKADGSMALTKKDRAQCLVDSFFPPPAAANLQNIAGTSYPEPISLPSITEEEIFQAVTNAAPNKAPGEDDIPNHIIKLALPTIMPALVWIFNSSITTGYCPKHFRESITVSLCKPNKPDYSIPKAYRPIALLNTMGKVMESIIATRLSFATEAHNLLPRSHFGDRRGTSPEHARARSSLHHGEDPLCVGG